MEEFLGTRCGEGWSPRERLGGIRNSESLKEAELALGDAPDEKWPLGCHREACT